MSCLLFLFFISNKHKLSKSVVLKLMKMKNCAFHHVKTITVHLKQQRHFLVVVFPPARSLLVMPLPLVFAVQEALQLGRGSVLLGLGRQGRCLAGLALARRPGRPRGAGLRHPVHHLGPFNVILETEAREESEEDCEGRISHIHSF